MNLKKVISVLVDVILFVIFAGAALLTIVSLNTANDGVPRVFGYIPLSIQSKSMESVIKKGDLIIVHEAKAGDVKVNDIIAFFATEQNKTIIKTHRVVQIEDVNGIKIYTTKGDNNEVVDKTSVGSADILAKYTGTRIPLLGYILDFLQSQVGFLFFVIIPLFCIFVYQLYRFICDVIESKKKEIEVAK